MKKLLSLLSLVVVLTMAFTCFAVMASEVAPEAETEVVEQPATDPATEPEAQTEQDKVETVMELKVGFDKSAEYSQIMEIPAEYFEIYKQNEEAMKTSYQEMGMTLEIYEENEQGFIKLTSSTAPGSPINFSSNGSSTLGYTFAEDKGLFGTKYFITANYDVRSQALETADEDAKTIATLTMKLPMWASFSDADESSNFGTTLLWNIKEGQKNPVSVVFSIPNFLSIAILLAVIIIAVVLVVLYLKKKKTVTDAEITEIAYDYLEGQTESDEFVDDPFTTMTDEEIAQDITDEPAAEEVVEEKTTEDQE